MVKENRQVGRLHFTNNAKEGVDHGQLQFIAAEAPPDEDGSADLQYVLAVANTIATHMTEEKIIVNKSTVPVGTADKIIAKVTEVLNQRGRELTFHVTSNPEFLKEGAAVNDCMKPDRIVIGTEDDTIADTFRELYAPFNRNHDRILFMDVRSAELLVTLSGTLEKAVATRNKRY